MFDRLVSGSPSQSNMSLWQQRSQEERTLGLGWLAYLLRTAAESQLLNQLPAANLKKGIAPLAKQNLG